MRETECVCTLFGQSMQSIWKVLHKIAADGTNGPENGLGNTEMLI